MTDNQATETAVATAERLENTSDPNDLDVLECHVTVAGNGVVTELELTLSTGGPHVTVNLYNATVTCSWGNETHTTHWKNDDLQEALIERYERLFDGQTINP